MSGAVVILMHIAAFVCFIVAADAWRRAAQAPMLESGETAGGGAPNLRLTAMHLARGAVFAAIGIAIEGASLLAILVLAVFA